MITEPQLEQEIERIKAGMATSPESSRDYQIGALGALLWVAGTADRGTSFALACQAWEQARPKGDWLTDLIKEIKAEGV